MSGFATTWTAAVWLTRPWGQEPDDVPVIGVVNRGTKRARVIVTWFKDNGSKVQQDSFDLDPNRSTRSVLVKANAPDTGWARIVATQPIAPWGITPHHLYVRAWANIEFYAENVVPLEEVPLPLGTPRK